MKIHHSTGSICLKGPLGLIYNVARIDYYLQENEEYEYIFTPNYSVIELLSDDYFQGIPGLNLDLKKDCLLSFQKEFQTNPEWIILNC